MRMLMRYEIPAEAGTEAIRDGSMAKAMQAVMAELKPEAAYFAPTDGCRTGYIVFDLESPAKMPVLLEPLFSTLHAKIELTPAMNLDDLMAGLQELSKRG